MKPSDIGFAQILQSTLRMARVSLGADLCVFMQFDDRNQLCVRAADGVNADKWDQKSFPVTAGAVADCLENRSIVRITKPSGEGMLALLDHKNAKKQTTHILVPVTGQSRTLGLFICGPLSAQMAKTLPEDQLRNTGALCAVLTAHWRMYEWLSSFTPQVNHELRTPLTAVQGSIGMVLGGMCGQVGGEMKEMLEMAQKGCERTVLAIEEYITKQLPDQHSAFNAPEPEIVEKKKKNEKVKAKRK
jgi:transcriptional regulator with GAF, ATPase, and Fis domain